MHTNKMNIYTEIILIGIVLATFLHEPSIPLIFFSVMGITLVMFMQYIRQKKEKNEDHPSRKTAND